MFGREQPSAPIVGDHLSEEGARGIGREQALTVVIATSDLVFEGRHNIDRVALSADLVAESVDAIGNTYDGKARSDHFGVVAEVSTRRVS